MSPPAANNRVLVADDDLELLALLGFALRNAGFEVTGVSDGLRALQAFAQEPFALAVLDVNMPGADGFTVCARVRERSAMPLIMLSARSEEADIVHALDSGADDYITKPFSPRTLIARIRALLRRSESPEVSIVETGNAVLDVERRALRLDQVDFSLTGLETKLLQALLSNPGRVVTTERLVIEAWGRSGPEERHALKQVIYRLRRKLEARSPIAGLLQTTRNAGYRWGDGRERVVASGAALTTL